MALRVLESTSCDGASTAPKHFSALLREDYNKWGKLLKEANIKLDEGQV